MKKIIFITILIFINYCFSAHTFEYRVIKDNVGYSKNERELKIKKGAIISSDHSVIYGNIVDDNYFMCMQDANTGNFISLAYLELMQCNTKLPEKIITYTEKGFEKKAIPAYFLDILYSKNRNILEEYEVIDNLYRIQAVASYLNNDIPFYAIVTNIGIELHNSDEIDFTNIEKKSDEVYECDGIAFGLSDNPLSSYETFQWYSVIIDSKRQIEKFTLKIDGDYLSIDNKTTGKHIITLAYVDDTVIKELCNLFENNQCNLSKVKFPRHADNSCDYENGKIVNKKNVAQHKRMKVKENLKLRSGEASSTQVLTVMSAGTTVRILELGKAEIIDGISSNWVKVEVQFDATDRNGNPIKPGTVGWCFGGFLE